MKSNDLHRFLSFGTIGHNHLLAAGQKAFALAEAGHDSAASIEMGVRLLCMAWGEFPLNAPLAAQIVSLSSKTPLVGRFVAPRGLAVIGRIAGLPGHDDPVANQLFAQGEYEGMGERLHSVADQEGALAIARQAVMLQSLLSNWEWLDGFISGPVAKADQAVADLLLPDVVLATGSGRRAVAACEKYASICGLSLGGLKLALAYEKAGDTEKALDMLAHVLKEFPGHTTALSVMDALAFPGGRDGSLPGQCAVSIYSYNKADELAQTLESVLSSDLGPDVGDVVVRVLINGSEDDSLAVARAARETFAGRMEIIDLPVNVGAPAARNWLLDAARRDGAEWIAFLDDDVLVPHDWLRVLAAGTEEFPDAGVWGCRVADAMSPSLTQHADGYLMKGDGSDGGYSVVLHEPAAESLVPQQGRARRYCASVTGCCHLFRTETLAANKGFDLQFSPSQFDDLDSDLRLLATGKPAACLGDLTITHLRKANQFIEQSAAARIQGENHRSLLEKRHAGHLDALMAVQADFIDRDLEAKRIRLEKKGLIS